jgi:hypothetical protein
MLNENQGLGRSVSTSVSLVGLAACGWTPKHHVADGLNGAAEYAHVINGRSGRCLDVNGGATTSGARVIQFGCHTVARTSKRSPGGA